MTIFLENISGGSDYGLSQYKPWTKCPKQAHLKKQHWNSLTKQEKRNYYQNQVNVNTGPSVGIMGHLLLENYFKKKIAIEEPISSFVWKHDYHKKAFEKAYITFLIWIEIFDHIKFDIVNIEENIEIRNKKTFIVSPYSGRLDLILNITQKNIDDLKKLRDPEGNKIITNIFARLTPGLWIVDHKFYGAETEARLLEAQDNLAYASYPKLYELKHKKKITGIIQNTLYTTKVPKFRMYILKPQPLKKFKIEMKKVIENMKTPTLTDINWCLNDGYHRPCYYRKENLCKGY